MFTSILTMLHLASFLYLTSFLYCIANRLYLIRAHILSNWQQHTIVGLLFIILADNRVWKYISRKIIIRCSSWFLTNKLVAILLTLILYCPCWWCRSILRKRVWFWSIEVNMCRFLVSFVEDYNTIHYKYQVLSIECIAHLFQYSQYNSTVLLYPTAIIDLD